LGGVGKGARNRARREREADGPVGARGEQVTRRELASAVFDLETAQQFRELIAAEPRLLEEATIRELDGPPHAAGFAEQFARLQTLLREARSDPDGAWARRQRWFDQAEQAGDQLEEQLLAAERALDAGQHDEALAVADAALPLAAGFGLGAVVLALHELRGRALLRRAGDRGANVDAAIDAFEQALQHSISGDQAAGLFDNLGAVHAQRPGGDRGENLENAIAAQRQGLAELDPDSSPEAVAIAQTNLAATLLTREHGDRAENLREAIELCRAALTYRSPSRDGVDWAYTQLNLAGALDNLATVTGADNSAALAAFKRVIEHRDHVAEPWLVGAAFASIGRLHLHDAQPGAERQLAAWEHDALDDLLDNGERLERARDCLEQARRLVAGAADPTLEGRLLRDLAAVYDGLGRSVEAIAVAERAVALLSVVGAPRDVVGVAFLLGSLHADRGDWPAATGAYAQAVRAAEAGLEPRLEDRAREDEQREMPTLHRHAALALARSGQPEQAALVLEAGRARAIGARLGVDSADPDSLDRLPRGLRDAYLSASAQVAAAPLGPAGAAQRRHLAEVVGAIRAQPGLAGFASGLKLAQIAAGAAPGSPLMYVNPTPYGTLLLTISANGEPEVHTRVLERPTGLELYGQVMVGANLDDDQRADEDKGPSYLLAITGHGDQPADLQRAIMHALKWVGEAVARPVAEELGRHGARSVTLVLCGPLGALPVGAAAWTDGDAERRLTDVLAVSYAPSALVAATARRRAGAPPSHRRLLALGDPEEDLEAAGPEVREIARCFAPQASTVAVGKRATLSFLSAHARGATHMHFACHAAGGLFDRDDTALVLADGRVSTDELTAIGELRPRLVVVSACQGAQSEIAGLPDEAVSIGAALLAAGAACAIAALWPVHDAATALLMVRLYEHLDEGLEPPDALRLAQSWLRELTEDDRFAFEAAHPLLRGELRRLPPDPDDPARGEPLTSLAATRRPFAHPDFWAGFVAMGI
jgi:CHAT domain-containing protein/tetratricopeptide (TPR) repeat protein